MNNSDNGLRTGVELWLYNTPERKKQKFVPLHEAKAGMYTCGPTVYNYAHIGNLRTYVFEDVLRRTLAYLGYHVTHVMNITDVGHLVSDGDTGEDKMETGARREGKTVWQIAEYYTDAFRRDLEALNIQEPHVWCRATDHIDEQIELVRTLESRGYAYRAEDGIYFDTSKFDGYADFAGLNVDGLKAGARVEKIQGKRNITDFALWKFSPTDSQRLMEWYSPWGTGFPGWHLECTAMSMKYLGESFDIHCGGVDHVNIHHTNEVAQAEAATGKKWVNYWLHGEFLVMSADRMSKSAGNFLTLPDIVKLGFSPMDYRFFLLMAHYRSKLTFTLEALKGAATSRRRIMEKIHVLKQDSAGNNEVQPPKYSAVFRRYRDEYLKFIADDLNTPRAVALLQEILKNRDLEISEKKALIMDMDQVLGLGFSDVLKDSGQSQTHDHQCVSGLQRSENQITAERVSLSTDNAGSEIPDELQTLRSEREQARKNGDWGLADDLRDRIRAAGYAVKDKPDGSSELIAIETTCEQA